MFLDCGTWYVEVLAGFVALAPCMFTAGFRCPGRLFAVLLEPRVRGETSVLQTGQGGERGHLR